MFELLLGASLVLGLSISSLLVSVVRLRRGTRLRREKEHVISEAIQLLAISRQRRS